jgi:hypothetical protein
MVSTPSAFAFEDGGRCYTCRVEEAHAGRPEAWWWFGVAGDDTRYAPFQAALADTEASVRLRIVAYYGDSFARRPWSAQRWERAIWRRRWECARPQQRRGRALSRT